MCAGVATLTVRELFDFAVDPHLTEDKIDDALDNLMEVASRCALRHVELQYVADMTHVHQNH